MKKKWDVIAVEWIGVHLCDVALLVGDFTYFVFSVCLHTVWK